MAATTKHRYTTDLSDGQWEVIRPLVERERHIGRPTVIDLREVVNALLYLTRTGCQWRMLPTNLPNWNTVRYYFDHWTLDGTFVRDRSMKINAHRMNSWAVWIICDATVVSRAWLIDLRNGHPLSENCPEAWKNWVTSGT